MTIQANDIIKSYDFHGRTDCYMVGLVERVERDGLIHCKLLKRVLEGKLHPLPEGRTFQTPKQGCSMMDEMFPDFQRIEVIA